MESPIIESSNGNSGDNIQQSSTINATTTSSTPTISTPSVAGCNIRVVCRVRPLTDLEKEKNERSIVHFNDSTSVSIRANGPQFTFDRIFSFDNSQQEVYEDVADPVVKDFLDGYHGTIIAYGQTASGKTHTMYGDPMNHGIIPRVMDNIFGGISKIRENDTTYSLAFCIKISALELYNEKLYDLFDSNRANLSIREHKQNGIYVEGISEVVVSKVEEAYEFLNISKDNRATASTNMSVASSRSHSILMIELSQQNLSTESSKISKLFLVDLAGSERATKTGVEGDRMTEAKNINLSLSALGKVINALTSGASFIPYRDSKLTRVLQDSLGGNSKTSLIINCSPSNNNEHETITTLQFGTRAKTIKNQPKINKKITYHELEVFIMRLSKELEKTCKERDEIIKSKNLEINNLLIQLENNQVTIVSNNQKLESLQQQQQQDEMERKEREKMVYIVDTEKNSGVAQQQQQQQHDEQNQQTIDEQEDDNLSISSRHSSIILDDLKDLDDTPNIQDIINSTINQDDESSSSDSDESENQIDLNGSSEIKIPTIDFNSTTFVNNNNNNSTGGNVDNNLRVSTSYITSSPSVSPRLNSNSSNVDEIDDNLFSSSSSPIIISSFKNKDFSSLTTGYSSGELNQILENSGSDIGGGGKSTQDSESEDNISGSEDEDDMKSSASTTTTTTTTTTIDMNANQPSSIEDPIEFTIIKSDKTTTSTLEKEIIIQPSSSIDNQQLLSSSLPAPQPITTSATLTTVTTTKITKTTNNIENIDINDDFGFSKIEDENAQNDGHKPNSTSNFLFDDYDENDNAVDGEDEDEEYVDNNLLNSFSHRGDFGLTPSSKLDFKNSGSNISTPIKDNSVGGYNIDSTTTTTPSTVIQSTTPITNTATVTTNVIESTLIKPSSKQQETSTTFTSPKTKKSKPSESSSILSHLPMFMFTTILFIIVTLCLIHLPDYKERLGQRRIYLDSIGIYSDYPTVDKLLSVKRDQILFAKELYGNSNSQKFQQQVTLINTAYNSLEQMNYLELVLSNFLNKSSINLRFSTDDYLIDKENELKRKIYSLESSLESSKSSNSGGGSSSGNGNHQSINEIIEKFETEIKIKKNTIKEFESKIDKLENQISIQKQVISSSSSDSATNTAAINKQIESLIEKTEKLEVDKKALATLLAKSETEKKQLAEKKTELDKEKIELTDKYNNANKKITQLEQDSIALINYPIALKESSISKALNYLATNTIEFVDFVSNKSTILKDNVQSSTNQFTQLIISFFKRITSKWFKQ